MKFVNKIFKCIVSLSLVAALTSGTIVKVDAASVASKTINDTYGKITGQVKGSIFVDAKNINTSATTTKKVPKLMANVDIHYYTTGNVICHEGTPFNTNVKHVGTDVDMSHFKNVIKNKYDGFLNTKLTAYGCAEAIVKKAYTFYTSCTY